MWAANYLYWTAMNWWLGGSILVGFGMLLRRLLGLGAKADSRGPGLVPLGSEREALYQSAAQAIQTPCAILGITLNDAFEERNAGRQEIAARLVELCWSEWERVDEVLTVLLRAVGSRMNDAQVVVPLRIVSAQRFKTRGLDDLIRMYELLDQLVFRSRTRFQLQVRVLRRASETLTAEFRRSCSYLERTGDPQPEFWRRLDFLYHDLDILGKELLLAFRAFLLCLPDSVLASFASQLEAALARNAHVTPV
ncbi:MAG TPA: hypothetical protein VFM21_03265 [Terriglobia bacterium]|nr:hypothetical protein [Terriglobia bacterium]